ncbi:hypothetical protein B9Z35_10365 [Limnohabitans sp. Jir61]|nr:hypothetical protein B9Z35_10365 [Limnohabitans sp. Jir61]
MQPHSRKLADAPTTNAKTGRNIKSADLIGKFDKNDCLGFSLFGEYANWRIRVVFQRFFNVFECDLFGV